MRRLRFGTFLAPFHPRHAAIAHMTEKYQKEPAEKS